MDNFRAPQKFRAQDTGPECPCDSQGLGMCVRLGYILGMEILLDLLVMKTPKSENHIFSIWSVCMYACVCVYYQHNL